MNAQIALPLVLIVWSLVAARADAEEIRFARDVLPVLSEKCFLCHGPDAPADALRLDSFQQATADLGGYRAIDVEHPSDSQILARITSKDEPMPPDDAEKPLTAAERDVLQRWIAAGGKYETHWAFVAPRRSAEPDDQDDNPSDKIDHFIGQTLAARDVDFAAPADRPTLARRVALVLTGLPPEADQLQQFLDDRSPEAYARYVDTMLASPRFGEHQARYWLDAVRYGDTHGLHLDNRRGIYPYRDWVVQAFNENLPLDDFITWQVAGDLLPDPTLAQQVATGFVRLNPSTGEGGAISEEFQAKNNFDRVETFGTVFLGMSLNCARCHNHKYDPVTQQEYYRLLAFFNSTAEPALDGNSYTYGPTVKVPADQQAWTQWNQLDRQRQSILDAANGQIAAKQMNSALVDYAVQQAGWKTADWQTTGPVDATQSAIPGDDGLQKWSALSGFPGSLSGRAARGKLPAANQAVWVRFTLELPSDQTTILTFSGGPGSCVFVDDQTEPVASKSGDEPLEIAALSLAAGKHTVRLKLMGFEGNDQLVVQTENPWSELAEKKTWTEVDKSNRLLMLADPSGPLAGFADSAQAADIARDFRKLQLSFTTTLVARELDSARPTRLLRRGEYDMPTGEPLQPGVPAVFNRLPQDAKADRKALADWLISPDNPLVARVLVNRIWQTVFGYGLVRTPEDFGLQGQQPTHPELLDWLAIELRRSDWDFKHLLRLMLTSTTFKQSSAERSDLNDPENRLFARGPRFRLDAEVIRDTGLWLSGLLDPTMGGEGVKPYQPAGMWIAMAHPASNTKQYQPDQGARLYRRSLYVYWKRTSPHPMMTLFDAPDRETSCVRRSRTSTALQSLALLNETQRVEMGRKLAERLIRQSQSDDDRIDWLFNRLACREPSDSQRGALSELLQTMLTRYRQSPGDAAQLLAIGDAPRDASQDAAEQAAWTQVALAVLASDLGLLLY